MGPEPKISDFDDSTIKPSRIGVISLQQFQKLTEEEVRGLIVDDKWLSTIAAAIQSEIDAI